MIIFSEDISAWSSSGTLTKTLNIDVSPDGSQTADGIQELTGVGFHYIYQQGSCSANSTHTGSIFVKKVSSETNFMGVTLFYTGVTNKSAYGIINTVEGTIVSSSSTITPTFKVDDYGDYWRFSITATDTGSNTLCRFGVYATLSTNGTTLGGGISSIRTIWGAQLEEGSYATSYIPTSGSAVTRSAETCKQDNLLTNIINASYPFTMYAEAKAVIDGNQHFLTFSNRSLSDVYFTLVLSSDGTVKLDARANGISEDINSSATAITNGDFFKTAVTMESATSGKICVNGVLDSKTNFTQQAINTNINDLLVGMLRTVTDTGRRIPVKDVKLYNTTLTDAELIALTS